MWDQDDLRSLDQRIEEAFATINLANTLPIVTGYAGCEGGMAVSYTHLDVYKRQLNDNDRHIVRPETDILTACAFNPPVTGTEVHDETGAYPADPDHVRATVRAE